MLLAQHFLQTESRSLKTGRVSFSPDAIAALMAHNWPGNVRELQNRIRRAMATFPASPLPPKTWVWKHCSAEQAGKPFYTLQEARNRAEQNCIIPGPRHYRQQYHSWPPNYSKQAGQPSTNLIKKHGITI
jgi:two-component system, NtrC family, response regulator